MDEKKPPSNDLVEPLTRRERAILLHLAEEKSYAEIAAQEVVSLNTVKWYIQQLYAKLGVNNRRQALERGRGLGLLTPARMYNPPAPPPQNPTPVGADLRVRPKSNPTSGSNLTPSLSPSEKTQMERGVAGTLSSGDFPLGRAGWGRILPTGTVTFLFTDIQGSTPLWEQEPEKMAAALQIHNDTLRQAIEANGGAVFKTVGDAFQAAFPTAPQALKAAIEGQQTLIEAPWNELGPLAVRMGLHTGEAELDPGGDEYAVSHAKNRIARIMSAAHGGQILLSAETYELCNHQLPAAVSLKDLGEHRLKGLLRPEHLYQVVVTGLPAEFPLPVSESRPSHNLPRQLTNFIGREAEISQVKLLLEKHPLVTLTGSGGVGKTRLSIQVAQEILEDYPDGIWLVELAPISDPALVSKAVSSTLGLREDSGRPIRDTLVDFLSNKQALIVLDNCEHLILACVQLVDCLLSACPQLKLLASSREALGVAGEMPYRVPSMAFPDPRKMPELNQLLHYEAVRLFLGRANTVLPGFQVTDKNARAVIQICQRLDGIPLAIELAAARMSVLTTEQLAQRLDNAFRLLTGGSRTALPRQQTLRAAIDWSHQLLSDQEQVLLRRLSVFAGGCTLEAAEAVCGVEGIESDEILDLLATLVNKSIVIAERKQGQETRYRFYEIVRQYAREKLLDAGENEKMCDRHLAYYLELAAQAESHLRGKGQQMWLDWLDMELDNIRLALEWAMANDIEKGLRLATALQWFWHMRNYWIEGTGWLDRLLAAEAAGRGHQSLEPERITARQIARGKALNATYWNKSRIDQLELSLVEESLAIFQVYGDLYPNDLIYSLYLSGKLDFKESADLFRKAGDQFHLTEVLFPLADTLLRCGELAQARVYIEERQKLCKEREDLEGQGSGLWRLGILEFLQGNIRRAVEFFKESRALLQVSNQEFFVFAIRYQAWVALAQGEIYEAMHFSQDELDAAREHAISWVIVDALGFLGWEARALGDEEQAVRRCEEALKFNGQVRASSLSIAFYVLGRVAIRRGQYARASVFFKELVTTLDAYKYPWKSSFEPPPVHLGIHVFGVLAAAQAVNSPLQARRAAVLFGAQASMVSCLMNIIPTTERLEYEQAVAAVHAALGEEAFTASWVEGQSMALEQAVAYALEEHE